MKTKIFADKSARWQIKNIIAEARRMSDELRYRPLIVLPDYTPEELLEIKILLAQAGDFAWIYVPEKGELASHPRYKIYCDAYTALEKHGGKALMKKPVPFGVAMVKNGDADALVGGITLRTADIVAYTSLVLDQNIKQQPVSSLYFTEVNRQNTIRELVTNTFRLSTNALMGLISYADTQGMHWLGITDIERNPAELSSEDICANVISAGQIFKNQTGIDPVMAAISYATGNTGFAMDKNVDKINAAIALYKQRVENGFLFAGPCQGDAALSARVAVKKGSAFASEQANLLVFPDRVSARAAFGFIRWALAGAHHGEMDVLACADMAINPDPDTAQLQVIKESSQKTFADIVGYQPKTAEIDINSDVYRLLETGHNLLLLPHLTAGNSLYKFMRHFIPGNNFFTTQGFLKPVYDVSRSETPEGIINLMAVAVINALAVRESR